MATLVPQQESNSKTATIDIAAAGNLNQLKVALRKAMRAIDRLEEQSVRQRARIRRLELKSKE